MKETRSPLCFFSASSISQTDLEERHVDVRGAVPAGESSNKVTWYSPVEKDFAEENRGGSQSNLHGVSPVETEHLRLPRCIQFARKGLSAEKNCAFFGALLAFLPSSPRTRRLALGSNGATAAQTEPLALPVPYRQAWRRASLRFTPLSRPGPRQDAEKPLLRGPIL